MSDQTLTFEKNGFVGIINMLDVSTPTKLARMADELTELCTEITWDDDIRVIVITAAAESTSSIEIGSIPSDTEASVSDRSLTDAVAGLSRPVIIALKGDVVGAGLELALACDVRIAGEGSRFGLPQIQSGRIPCEGGTQRLARLVGKGKALEMILTGEMVHTQEALQIGLVSKVVPLDQVVSTAMRMAEEMASKAPIALQYAKEAVYGGMELTLEQGLKLEADLYLLLHTTRDREMGISAFRDKKIPTFEGK